MMPKGLSDKLYWREETAYKWHCFKKTGFRGHPRYLSLCEKDCRYWIGGQSCRRPAAVLRCAICDGLEMKRRGWQESGPESKR